jgi:hypothetical protein
MCRALRRGGLRALRRASGWLSGALLLAVTAWGGVPAPGGEPLLAAAETSPVTALGTLRHPTRVDLHGWSAELRVERALAGDLSARSVVRIAWEELSGSRPARFRDGDRILVALGPLPGASLWSRRFPERDAMAVAAGGDAFLRAPEEASVEALAGLLSLTPEQRQGTPGIESLIGLVSRAQTPLAQAALRELADVPDLDSRMSPGARGELAGALADPGRPLELRCGVLGLIGERHLESLRSAVDRHARPGSPVEAEALAALARLDGGLPPERVALLIASENPEIRAVGVRNARATPSERRLSGILREDRDPRVRAAAVETLLAARGDAALDSATAALFDGDAQVREAAVRGLAGLGSAAVPTLENLVERRVADEARAPLAALALAGPDGRRALERIAAHHPDQRVRELARLMLGRAARPRH